MDITRLRPKDTPKLRQEVVANTFRVAGGRQAYVFEGMEEEMREEMTVIARLAERAPTWWVSDEMTKTAQNAAVDLGENDRRLPETLSGCVFFNGGLPPFSVAMPNMVEREMAKGRTIDTDRDTPIGVFWQFHKNDLVTSPIVASPAGYVLSGYAKTAVQYCVLGPNEGVWRYDDLADGADEYIEERAYIEILAAMWSLSQTPTVAELSTHMPATGPKIKGQRKRQAPSPIKVVELRQMKHQTVTHSSSGRQYTHRWIVRGHWRDQACGPGNKLRRRTWVPAYTKGPDGAPLLEKETVFAWKR